MPFTVPDLPYDYAALEPHIDEQTMRIHHDKHHQAYVDKANAALEGTEWADADVDDVLRSLDQLPDDIRTTVRNNAGGHSNHSFFWQIMSPDGGDRRRLRVLRLVQGGVQERGRQPLRLGLGLARPRRLGAGGRLDREPGLADLGRPDAAARRGRVGARLLPQVPEPAPGLHRRVVERRQLARGRAALRGGGLLGAKSGDGRVDAKQPDQLGHRSAEAAEAGAGGMKLIARSAIAVIVRLGFTPGLAGTAEPSHTSRFS